MKQKHLVLWIAAWMAAPLAATNAASPKDSMVLFTLKKAPPLVDGDLKDDAWKGIQVATGFLKLGKIEKAPTDTEVKCCYDTEKVYFGIKLFEPDVNRLKSNPAAVWGGDCVELFIDPTGAGRSYFHIIADSKGNLYSSLFDGAEKVQSLPVEAKAKVNADFWTLEIAIPFSALGTKMPADNQRWVFNCGRERYAGTKGPEVSSWCALGDFNQSEKFGKLTFYSRHEIDPNIAYWKNSDRDPLMGRVMVSGFDVARESAGARRPPTLWYSDPFAAERERHAKWKCSGLMDAPVESGGLSAKEKYPKFYDVALELNRAVVEKAKADERVCQLHKASFYLSKLEPNSTAPTSLDSASLVIDEELNAIYMAYGQAFDDHWNEGKLSGLEERIVSVLGRIEMLKRQAGEGISKSATAVGARSPWKAASLELPASDKRLNSDGASARLAFEGYGIYGHEDVFKLLGKFDTVNLGWQHAMAESSAPGQYVYKGVDKFLATLDRVGGARRFEFQTVFGQGYEMPFPAWLEDQAKADPDMILKSYDGLEVNHPYGKTWGANRLMEHGNPNNPAVMQFAQDYLTKLAAYANKDNRVHFFVSSWEDLNVFTAGTNPVGYAGIRSPGYNDSNKRAFRDYLKTRYGSLEQLNHKWGADYASFEAIEPPPDRFVQPATAASGLTYEFERWSRVNHVRYNAMQRKFLKEGAPNVPVMADDSDFMLNGNIYLMFKENAADIYSHHSNPIWEDAAWGYLGTMSRKFGKVLGYYENYWAVYRRAHLTDERLARRDVEKFFFTLYMRDIRLSTWWLPYLSHKTEYIMAYGGGTFNLDYDQTVYRWSTAEIAPMFERGRVIEKAMLESAPETPSIAIVQPCATVFNQTAMIKSHQAYRLTSALQNMFDAHSRLLTPWNYSHDFIPEEMVLDGKAALKDYRLLVLPPAPCMSEAFSMALMRWVADGGTLIALGSFALLDECGRELAPETSLFKKVFPQAEKTGKGDFDHELHVAGFAAKGQIEERYAVSSHGRGQVLYFGAPVESLMRSPVMSERLANALAGTVKRTAESPSADLKIQVRTGRDAAYLCLCNENVEKPVDTKVTVRGKFTKALDVLVPGWFPVPSRQNEGELILDIFLDPGAFTLIRLQSNEDPTP